MIESIVTFILGSFIIVNLIVRYKTINSPAFIENTQITVFIFASFAVGLIMVNMEKTINITALLTKNNTLRFCLFASPALLPIIFKVLHGQTFSSAIKLNFDIIAMPVVLFFALHFFLLPNNHSLLLIAYFTSFVIALGFLHSVLGGILSSFNIALIIASFFNHHVLSIDLNNIFDVLEQVGVVSPALKWLIMLVSILFGLHGSLNNQWLREVLR